MGKVKLSIIIPNYNEKENLDRGVLDEVAAYLKKVSYSWEVIINEDSSTDGSGEIIARFVKKHPGFKMIKGAHAGKAAGIWNGMRAAKGEIFPPGSGHGDFSAPGGDQTPGSGQGLVGLGI